MKSIKSLILPCFFTLLNYCGFGQIVIDKEHRVADLK